MICASPNDKPTFIILKTNIRSDSRELIDSIDCDKLLKQVAIHIANISKKFYRFNYCSN